MNIKSLLIGSAAALVAVSGARAADAVVAEPEAVEYVRVCDAYGAGFFYIPGTETCLKIGGYVRYQIDYANGDKGWRKTAKASLNFTASSDTELGTLTSYIESLPALAFPAMLVGINWKDTGDNIVQANELSIDGTINLDYAWISLGGLTMGYHDTAFSGGLDGEGGTGGYGDQVHLMSYTFSGGNGFSATLSLEEDTNNVNWVPNIVGKVSYSAGNIGVDGWVAYDDKDGAAAAAAAAWNVKGRVSVAVGDAGSLKVIGFYSNKVQLLQQLGQVVDRCVLLAQGQRKAGFDRRCSVPWRYQLCRCRFAVSYLAWPDCRLHDRSGLCCQAGHHRSRSAGQRRHRRLPALPAFVLIRSSFRWFEAKPGRQLPGFVFYAQDSCHLGPANHCHTSLQPLIFRCLACSIPLETNASASEAWG